MLNFKASAPIEANSEFEFFSTRSSHLRAASPTTEQAALRFVQTRRTLFLACLDERGCRMAQRAS